MKYQSVFAFVLSSMILDNVSASTEAPKLEGTYTSTCEWHGNTPNINNVSLASKMSFTFEDNILTLTLRDYQDSQCNILHTEQNATLTFTVGGAIPGYSYEYGPPYNLILRSTEDATLSVAWCFYLNPNGFSDAQALYFGMKRDSLTPCIIDFGKIYAKPF